jgi:hypothetical protein
VLTCACVKRLLVNFLSNCQPIFYRALNREPKMGRVKRFFPPLQGGEWTIPGDWSAQTASELMYYGFPGKHSNNGDCLPSTSSPTAVLTLHFLTMTGCVTWLGLAKLSQSIFLARADGKEAHFCLWWPELLAVAWGQALCPMGGKKKMMLTAEGRWRKSWRPWCLGPSLP